jgi:hypothetical protein
MAEAIAKQAADETLPEPVREGWRFLASILRMHFRSENAPEPFGPMVQLADGRRSITPDDLTAEHLVLLRAVATTSRDAGSWQGSPTSSG